MGRVAPDARTPLMQLITPIKARYGRSTFDLAERAIDAIYRRCNTTFWFSHGLDPKRSQLQR
jgi:hypothetical protein